MTCFHSKLAMVDNAEWNSGHNSRFGIQYVNYTSLERTFKYSALALCEFMNAARPYRFNLISFPNSDVDNFAAEFYNSHAS